MKGRAIVWAGSLPDVCMARVRRGTCRTMGFWRVQYPGQHRKNGRRVLATSPRCDAHALQWCRTYQVPVPAQLSEPGAVNATVLRVRPEAPYTCPYCEATHQTGPAHVEHVKGHAGGGRSVEERLAELEARVARLEDWARRTGTFGGA